VNLCITAGTINIEHSMPSSLKPIAWEEPWKLFAVWGALFAWALVFAPRSIRQTSKSVSPEEWDKLLAAARKEKRIVVSIPASIEFRKQLEEDFQKQFRVEVEVFAARGSSAVRRMADEFKSSARYFDVHISGSSSAVSGLLDEGLLDAIEP